MPGFGLDHAAPGAGPGVARPAALPAARRESPSFPVSDLDPPGNWSARSRAGTKRRFAPRHGLRTILVDADQGAARASSTSTAPSRPITASGTSGRPRLSWPPRWSAARRPSRGAAIATHWPYSCSSCSCTVIRWAREQHRSGRRGRERGGAAGVRAGAGVRIRPRRTTPTGRCRATRSCSGGRSIPRFVRALFERAFTAGLSDPASGRGHRGAVALGPGAAGGLRLDLLVRRIGPAGPRGSRAAVLELRIDCPVAGGSTMA